MSTANDSRQVEAELAQAKDELKKLRKENKNLIERSTKAERLLKELRSRNDARQDTHVGKKYSTAEEIKKVPDGTILRSTDEDGTIIMWGSGDWWYGDSMPEMIFSEKEARRHLFTNKGIAYEVIHWGE